MKAKEILDPPASCEYGFPRVPDASKNRQTAIADFPISRIRIGIGFKS